jgi:hypothetical protein
MKTGFKDIIEALEVRADYLSQNATKRKEQRINDVREVINCLLHLSRVSNLSIIREDINKLLEDIKLKYHLT